MTAHPQKLNPPRRSLRPWRALFLLLLRTAAWTAVGLGCALYCLNAGLSPAPAKAPAGNAPGARPGARPASLKALPKAPHAGGLAIADPLSLIKLSKAGSNNKEHSAEIATRPRLKSVTFAGSGGNFIPLGQDEPVQAPDRAEAAPRDPEAVVLPASARTRAVKVKGARPVPAAAGKKYSGMDPEAEFLRERMRRRAEADGLEKLRLRNEKLLLSGWLALLAAAAMLIPSGVIKAWRLIHKPEGAHWTLR